MHFLTHLAGKLEASAKAAVASSFSHKSDGRSDDGLVHTPEGVIGLQDIDFIEHATEPRAFDHAFRHDLIQKKMANWREIFLGGLTHQIALARDPDYLYARHKLVECDGVIERELDYVAPEPWWYEQDGELRLRLNFGERTWCVKGKNPVIRIGTAEELLPTLEKLHLLAGSGEFDEIIEKMVIVSHR